uniref:Carboxylesterase type B domain-containing protein n=1 Tax=Panagrolaimus sp. ES5 TaxID=591445 RepID=A0AC34FEJ1_9BILA
MPLTKLIQSIFAYLLIVEIILSKHHIFLTKSLIFVDASTSPSPPTIPSSPPPTTSTTSSSTSTSAIPKGNNSIESVFVYTELGRIKGFVADITEDFKADVFLGVPFAQPPIGHLRFETTHPETGWPVLVVIHGVGGYGSGSASSFGFRNISDNFVSKGLVVVTIQYRLGFMGFASTGDCEMPGNLGYWDQLEAFRFVRAYIRSFGGDPEKITALGVSSGASSVAALSVSPYSRDLIHSFISLSGSTYAKFTLNDDVIAVTNKLAQLLKCPTLKESSAGLKSCFKRKNSEDFLKAVKKIGSGRKDVSVVKFHPIFDGDFFPKDIPELIQEAPKKPVMMGYGNQEAAYLTVFGRGEDYNQFAISITDWEKFTEENFTDYVRTHIAREFDCGEQAPLIQQEIYDFYFTNNNDTILKPLKAYTNLVSDILFKIPILREARAKHNAEYPVFLYYSQYYSSNLYDDSVPIKGWVHSNEKPYLFGLYPAGEFEFNDDDKKFREVLVNAIVEFTKNGDPSTPEFLWPPTNGYHPFQYAHLSPTPYVGTELGQKKLEFWDQLTEKYELDIIRGIHRSRGRPREEL